MDPVIFLVLTVCLFVLTIVGHFVGDYLLQNDWMALNKTKRNKLGWQACSLHVILYTLSVVICLSLADKSVFLMWWIWLIIGIPHYLIDHYSLASYIMLWKNGVKPFEVVKDDDPIDIKALWKVGFNAPVYILNDNTLHWICLLATCHLMVKFL
jgi:hypothetical protein